MNQLALTLIILSLYGLWVFYLAVMCLWRAHKQGAISKPAIVPAYLTLAIGAVLDCLVNITVMSILFLEPPRQLLVTQRLQYHIRNGKGWRKALAYWVCRNYLNAFDPTGDHCD